MEWQCRGQNVYEEALDGHPWNIEYHARLSSRYSGCHNNTKIRRERACWERIMVIYLIQNDKDGVKRRVAVREKWVEKIVKGKEIQAREEDTGDV